MIQDGHAAPVVQSLMKSMYETGVLDATCAVLRCEGFDNVIMEEVQSADGPPRIRNILIRNSEWPRHLMHRGVSNQCTAGGKRPNADNHNGEVSQGPSEERKLGSGRPHAESRKVGSTAYKTRK